MIRKQYLVVVAILVCKIATAQLVITGVPDQVKGRGGSFESLDLSEFTQAEGDVFWEVEFLKPENTGTPPSWELDEASFQFEMTVTVEVESKGRLAEGEDHLLAVENEQGQLRGLANAIQVGDKWAFFLTVFSNTAGESLYFKFYDAEFDQILRNNESFEFTPNDAVGNPEEPYFLQVGTFDVDVSGNVLTATTLDDSFVGADELVIFARLIGDPTTVDSDTINLEVLDDYVPVIDGVPNQIVPFGGSFDSFNLNDFISLSDEDLVDFSYSGNDDISVSIDQDGVVTLSQPSGFAGSDTITFQVTDVTANALSSSQEVVFIVRDQEQAPVLSNLPDLKTGLNGAFVPIDLWTFVETNNPEGIRWSYDFVTDSSDTQPDWSVNTSDFQYDMTVTIEATSLGKVLEGNSHFVSAFSQTDSTLLGVANATEVNDGWYYFLTVHSNSTVDSVFFKVFDANASRVLPVRQTLTFEANNVIGDPLEPFNIDAGYIEVFIDEESTASFEFIAESWSGVESISFIATDTTTREQLSGKDTMNIEVLNVSSPKISPIPDQEIDEGSQFQSIDLAEYLLGMEASDVIWEISGAEELSPVLSGSVVTLTVPDDYFGVSTLTVFVQSSELSDLTNETSFKLIVNNINDAPVFTSNPVSVVEVDDLYNYEIGFSDADNTALTLTISSKPEWLKFFAGDDFGLLYGTPSGADVGVYELSLTLSDGEVETNQNFNIEVIDVIRPVLADIPDQLILEGESFESIYLPDFLSGIEASDVNWEVQGAEILSPAIDNELLSFSIPDDYYGVNEINVIAYSKTDSSLFDEDLVSLTIENVNDGPVLISDPVMTADATISYETILRAVDADNDPLTFTVISMPDWVNTLQEGNSMVLFGVPSFDDLGESEVSISVSDGIETASMSFTLVVSNPLGMNNSEHVVVYPNPFIDIISFTLENVIKSSIIDQNGKLIKSVTGENLKNIHPGAIRNGVYFLVLKDNLENVYVKRIIKK